MLKKLRQYLPQMVYGAVDGTVTTFAVVAGATGGDLSHRTIIILGLANLFADGASMSISAYLAAKSESPGFFSKKNSLSIAIWTLLSFVFIGFIPLIPYIFAVGSFSLSCLVTGIAFFTIGSLKGIISRTGFLISGLQTLALGTLAAAIAYLVGAWLAGI